jgi:hypothetical protein
MIEVAISSEKQDRVLRLSFGWATENEAPIRDRSRKEP